MEKDVVEEIMKECINNYIIEERYQKIKQGLGKKDDYFSLEEIINYAKITLKLR